MIRPAPGIVRTAVGCVIGLIMMGSVCASAQDSAPDGGLGPTFELGTPTAEAQASGSSTQLSAVSGNPAFVNILVGNGALGDALGINHDGWRLGGMTINDANGILVGGLGPGRWAGQNLTIADLSFDTEQGDLWNGGLFGAAFLYYNGYGAGPTVNGIEQSQGSPNALADRKSVV